MRLSVSRSPIQRPGDKIKSLVSRRSKGCVFVFYTVSSAWILWSFCLPFDARTLILEGSSGGWQLCWSVYGYGDHRGYLQVRRARDRDGNHFLRAFHDQCLGAGRYFFLGCSRRTCRCSVGRGYRHRVCFTDSLLLPETNTC